MYSLFKKEIVSFFGSLIGYIAIIVFLLMTGMFLWVFPGNYNILDNGYSTLESLFSLAPWLYLFLVPAVTMRLFADEKRQGTIEILLTHPLSNFKLVFAKFAAGMVLVSFSILPTLIYFLSVYLLGNPVGNIDVGATWGSFIGLFFLASIYVAIGVFASSLTDNQIVSFILSMGLSFVSFIGFEFIGSSGVPYLFETVFTWLSINEHYLSVSRGVVDFRDLFYFVGMTGLFIYFTTLVFRRNPSFSIKRIIRNLRFPALLLIIFFITENISYRIDLTSDKRYSVTDVSKSIVSELDNYLNIELFLAGELPAESKRLQRAIVEKVSDFNLYSSKKIRIKVTDPYSVGNSEKRKEFFEKLSQHGIKPTNFRIKTEKGVETKLIFPGAVIQYGKRGMAVNFLKNNPGFSSIVNLKHSVESIEFELISAFQKLIREKVPTLAFLKGHDELNKYEVFDISTTLAQDFNVIQIDAASLNHQKNDVDALIIASPIKPFSEADKLAIDQYIMNGGKVMWLVDPVRVHLDSLSTGETTFAFPRDLNIDDQLFRYGVRLNTNLLQDVVCVQKMVNTNLKGNQPEFTPHPWYYSPLLTPSDKHPISKNLNQVMSEFVSSVDTVGKNPKISKSVILSTSPYSRKVNAPVNVSLRNIDNPPARELFNVGFIPVGVLLEGEFTSVFKNRMMDEISNFDGEFLTESKPTKMIVIADGSIIANQVQYSGEKPSIRELGYDRTMNQTFGNKEFLINAISYLTDGQGIMQLRNRSLKLRLLDKVRLNESKSFWKWLNVSIPLLLIILFGIVFNSIRYRKYSKKYS